MRPDYSSTEATREVIEDAEEQGLLHPHTGSTIFEGTVGSTGISIATIGRAKYVRILAKDNATADFCFPQGATRRASSCRTT